MLVRVLVIIVGLTDVLAGGSLLVARRWFFDTIAPFPPYSPHFMGDAGAFLLPVGGALLIAATNPTRYFALLVLGAAVSVLHLLNHLYGSATAGESWLQTFEVGVIAVAMLIAVAMVWMQSRSRA